MRRILVHRFLRHIGFLIVVVALAAGCSTDTYQQRTDTLKAHVKTFYDDLAADRVGSAIAANERIEAIAAEAGADVRRRGRPVADNRMDRDWMMVKTARETAAENWLALGRYFLIKKQFDQARGAYKRVLADDFRDPAYHVYVEQAERALRDVDVVNPR